MAINRAGENTLTYLLGKLKSIIDGKLDKSGGTMTGRLILAGEPTGFNDAVNKNYVDGKTGGPPINYKQETWIFALEDGSKVEKKILVYDASGLID